MKNAIITLENPEGLILNIFIIILFANLYNFRCPWIPLRNSATPIFLFPSI
jgi:hypothetical protein